MPLHRITVTHTERNDSGSATSVEVIYDVEKYDDRDEIGAVIQELIGAAQFKNGSAMDPPPAKADDPAASPKSPHPARWESKAPKQPVEVKLGTNGWRINCPIHGDHAANLFEGRGGMPAVIKCTASSNGEFCRTGAPPPKGAVK